jgi:hypothetical protein
VAAPGRQRRRARRSHPHRHFYAREAARWRVAKRGGTARRGCGCRATQRRGGRGGLAGPALALAARPIWARSGPRGPRPLSAFAARSWATSPRSGRSWTYSAAGAWRCGGEVEVEVRCGFLVLGAVLPMAVPIWTGWPQPLCAAPVPDWLPHLARG